MDEEICLVDTGQQNTCSARPLCFVGYFKRGSISKYWSILNMGINIVRTELKLSSFGQSNWLSTCPTMRCHAIRFVWLQVTKVVQNVHVRCWTNWQAGRQGDGETEAETAQKRRNSLMNCWAAVQTASQLEIHVQRTFLFAALQFFRIVFANCCTQRNFFGDGIGIGEGKALCSVSQLTIFNKLIHIASAAQMSHNSCLVSLFSAFH